MKIDKYQIRSHNTSNILKNIITYKNISRVDLSTLTGLNKASVSDIIKELIDKKLIIEAEVGEAGTQGGRKPIMLTLNKECAQSISIDIAPKYIEGIICHLDGTIIKEKKIKTIPITKENVCDLTLDLIHELENEIPSESVYGITGISLAIHGVVSDNTILYTPNYTFPENFYQTVKDGVNIDNISMDNEAQLAALGEYTFGNHSESLISFNIGTGIGAGLVDKGKLKIGNHGFLGEIGHSILIPNGIECPCGNKGCLERYASQRAIYENTGLDIKNSDDLVQELENHPEKVTAVLKENALFISIAINNFIMINDPEVIIINSSVYDKLPFMFEEVKKNINNRFSKYTKICSSSLNKKATLLGGITKNIQSFLLIENFKLDS